MTAALYPSLEGSRVLVTGGGSGIGAAIVEAFARQKAQVVFVDILEKESRELAARLSAGTLASNQARTGASAGWARLRSRYDQTRGCSER